MEETIMAASSDEAVLSVFDTRPMGRLQWLALSLCGLCMVVDGYDVQAMAYAAPALMKTWGIERTVLGPVFSAGLLGMFAGSLLLAVLADRIGRRPLLVAASMWVAGCMAVTAHAGSLDQLIAIRFAAGVGMGAIVPNAMSLAGEYSPSRLRVTLMMAVSSGYIAGGVLGGAVAAFVIETFGWRGVFDVGALLTAILAMAMWMVLPESIQFALARRPGRPQTLRLLQRAVPNATLPPEFRTERPDRQPAVATLFGEGRAVATPLLWGANFANMLCAYFLAAWIPLLMAGNGASPGMPVLAGTALWLGGLLGNWLLGLLIDRRGYAVVLITNFIAGGMAIVGISVFHAFPVPALACIAFAGFCVLGGQSGLNALAVVLYPSAARATGAGWALGVGRLGAVLGPVAGGYLMAMTWTAEQTLIASALPAVAAAVAVGMLGRIRRQGAAPVAQTAA
jgi:MFS transporter, AAHS family, 4-hydroxybenzoate transporter